MITGPEKSSINRKGEDVIYSIDIVVFEFTCHVRLLLVVERTDQIHHVAQAYFEDQRSVSRRPNNEGGTLLSRLIRMSMAEIDPVSFSFNG